jgi:hypothetical protein
MKFENHSSQFYGRKRWELEAQFFSVDVKEK